VVSFTGAKICGAKKEVVKVKTGKNSYWNGVDTKIERILCPNGKILANKIEAKKASEDAEIKRSDVFAKL